MEKSEAKEKLKKVITKSLEKKEDDLLKKHVINKFKNELKVNEELNIKNSNKINIDSIITFIFLKKLLTPIIQTNAYKLGLIDKSGKIIKAANSSEEKNSLTLLDKIIFKLRRLLGSKLLLLNKFIYLKNLSTDFYQKLAVKGSIEQRAELIRINKDITNMQEKYKMDFEDILSVLMNENILGENKNEV